MEALNVTQLLAEFGTNGLWATIFIVVLNKVLPVYKESMKELNASMRAVDSSMKEVKASQDKLLDYHTQSGQ